MKPLGHMVAITYTNYKGETANRFIFPISIWYGRTRYYPYPGWLLRAYDTKRRQVRDFSMGDIHTWM